MAKNGQKKSEENKNKVANNGQKRNKDKEYVVTKNNQDSDSWKSVTSTRMKVVWICLAFTSVNIRLTSFS